MSRKGGQQETKVEIPKELRREAENNIKLANFVARMPQMLNFGGQVAAFTPQQTAGMAASDAAAASLGMPTAGFNGGMNIPGMPASSNFGGINAYSTQGVYEDAMSRVPPEIRAMYEALFKPGALPGAPAPASAAPARQPMSQGRVHYDEEHRYDGNNGYMYDDRARRRRW